MGINPIGQPGDGSIEWIATTNYFRLLTVLYSMSHRELAEKRYRYYCDRMSVPVVMKTKSKDKTH